VDLSKSGLQPILPVESRYIIFSHRLSVSAFRERMDCAQIAYVVRGKNSIRGAGSWRICPFIELG